MKVSTKRRPPLRFCALVVLSLGLLFPAGAAQASAPGTVVAWAAVATTILDNASRPAFPA
jgi:hypothetical protein